MTMQLTFEFTLQPYEISLMKYSGAFSLPTGVSGNLMTFLPNHMFSFKEIGTRATTFGRGAFFKGFL